MLLLSFLRKWSSNWMWNSLVFSHLFSHSKWCRLRCFPFWRWWETKNFSCGSNVIGMRSSVTLIDWFCFYYFVRNILVALLVDLCAPLLNTHAPLAPYPPILFSFPHFFSFFLFPFLLSFPFFLFCFCFLLFGFVLFFACASLCVCVNVFDHSHFVWQ